MNLTWKCANTKHYPLRPKKNSNPNYETGHAGPDPYVARVYLFFLTE